MSPTASVVIGRADSSSIMGSSLPSSRPQLASIARVQSLRTALTERPMRGATSSTGHVLQITKDEYVAIVGGESFQRIGQEHRLLAADGACAGARGGGGGQRRLDVEARPVERRLQRFLATDVAAPGPVVLGLVGQGPDEDLPEPADQLGLAAAEELGELAMGLQVRLLDQVGGVEPDLESPADQGPGQDPEIAPIKLQQQAPRGIVAGAGLLQELLGSRLVVGHSPIR